MFKLTSYLILPLLILICNSSLAQYKWEKLNTESYRGKQDDIFFVDENNGWYINGYGHIYHTKDGGHTWEKVFETNRPYEISWKLFFPSDSIGYATIQNYNPDKSVEMQHFVKTTDGGRTWKENELYKDKKARPFGVGFLDNEHGYVGTMTTGLETKDGGKSWEKIDLGMACNKIRIVNKPNGEHYGYAIGINVFRLEKE